MKKNKLLQQIILLNLIFLLSVNSQIKLPEIVSSNMVLQRNTTINLWGWAAPNEKITLETSWTKEIINVEAKSDGTWNVDVETTNSRDAHTIQINSNTSNINLDNILFGEVWLCSGQSNMEMPLRGFVGQPTYGGPMAILRSTNPNLRLFTVGRFASKTPLNDLQKNEGWKQASPETVEKFSAVAYFFGQQLQEILDVPVGLIHSSWGASNAQAWMSYEAYSQFITFDLDEMNNPEKPNQTPTMLFNAMINPIIPYTIKGAIWYQGEANRTDYQFYKKIFPAMVNDWRERWDLGDFPFYFTQIAPFTYGGINAYEPHNNTAFIRKAQLDCVELIPNSGIAITTDLGDRDFIHPPKKKDVADRLLFNALNQTYGMKAIKYQSPTFNSLEIKDNGITLSFNNSQLGLYTFDTLEGFEIAGEDKVFYPANANIVNRKTILVTNDSVKNPVAVRYAWSNFVEGTLFDTSLLPLSSFRTDNWDDATRAKP